MNVRDDSLDLVSIVVFMGVQQNVFFIVDLDVFFNCKDLFFDDNGFWKMMGVCLKFFIVKKEGSKVVRIEKVGIEEDVDIVIRRRFYICKFCISFK